MVRGAVFLEESLDGTLRVLPNVPCLAGHVVHGPLLHVVVVGRAVLGEGLLELGPPWISNTSLMHGHPLELVEKLHRIRVDRITSYNVCYTKLLRSPR